MKTKSAKSITVLTVAIIFATSLIAQVYAQEQNLEKDENLSIDLALEKASQTNLNLREAYLTRDNARISYEKARANILQSQSKIDEKQAELEWQQAENTFEKSRNEIEIEVISLYSDCKYLTFLLSLKKEKVQLAENNLNRVREKIKAGTAGELEQLAAEISLENARQQLRNTEQQLETAKNNFSVATGIKNITSFNFVSRFQMELAKESLETYMTQALENRKEIQFAEKRVEIASDRLEQVELINSPRLDVEKAKNDLELLRLSLSLLKESIKSEVRQKYYQLESLTDQNRVLNLQLNQARKNFDNAGKQFQAGLITEDELSSERISFEETSLELEKNKASYYVAHLNLQVSVGEVLGLGGENES